MEVNAAEDLLCRPRGIGESDILKFELVCASRRRDVFVQGCFCNDGLELFQPGDIVSGGGGFGDTYGMCCKYVNVEVGRGQAY